MKQAQRKDFLREIRKSLNRYLSILFIVALGVAFYAGIRSAEPDMQLSADAYFDETRLMDIRVLGILGMSQGDVEAIGQIEGITAAEGGYSVDVLTRPEEIVYTLQVLSLSQQMNQMTIKEGRLPQAADECFADQGLLEAAGLSVGDELTLQSGTEDDLEDSLNESTYTIVGSGTYSWFLNMDRGTTSIGDGDIDGFIAVLPEAFCLDYYSVVYARADGLAAENCYGGSYEDAIEAITDKIEAIADNRCEIHFAEIKEDAQEKINDGEKELADAREEADKELTEAAQEIADAEKELADARAELLDAQQQLADGKQEIIDGRREIADAKAELAEKEQELNDAKAKLPEARQEIEDAQKELEQGRLDFAGGVAQWEEGRKELDNGWHEYNGGVYQLEQAEQQLEEQAAQAAQAEVQLKEQQAQLTQQQAQLQAQEEELAGQEAALNQQIAALEAAGIDAETVPEIQEALAQLEAGKQQLEAGKEQLAAGLAQIEAALAQIEASKPQIEAGRQQIEENKKKLDEALEELEKGEEELDASWKSIQVAAFTLEYGEQQLADAKQQLADAEAEITDGEVQIADGWKELADAEQELNEAEADIPEAEQEIADGWEELRKGEQELADGKQEYEDGKKEAEEKIADAEQELADAQKTLNDLEYPEWYVLDRNSIQSYVEFGMDSQRIGAIGKVFPAIFFLVAALVSLTTMTRMVEEERTLIGTMKALGYSKWAIASKYLLYALSASLVGSLLGVAVGSQLLPWVIMTAYGMLYTNLQIMVTPVNMSLALLATGIAVACTAVAALGACYKELLSTPAQLMRPASPPQGKRIILEYIPFLWKRMTFTSKSTVRNLFRYKKRFFMTIFGIGASMALLMVGYGIRDSIQDIVDNQYRTLWIYDTELTIDDGLTLQEQEAEREKMLEDYPQIADTLMARSTALDVGSSGVEKSAYIFVPQTTEGLEQFVVLKDRLSDEAYELSEDGVIISEKLSKLLDVQVGDEIYLKDGDTAQYTARVTAISENYLYHYVYMTSSYYESLYGEAPVYNHLYLNFDELAAEDETAVTEQLLAEDMVEAVQFASGLQATVQDMLKSLDMVIWVLIISAGLLAFVVLYNLNNINITERRRELATLKVLGFYDTEVAAYVYRENIYLTIIGIGVGALLGVVLHRFVVLACEIDMMMFGRQIRPMSYVYSIALTILFSLLVNLFMFYRLRKIDMVESLKSVE